MNWIPIGILVGISLISLGINMAKHGQPDKYNAWITLISNILSWGLILWGILG